MKKILTVLILAIAFAITAHAQEPEKLVGNESFVILSTKRIQTMEKELGEMGKKGYHVLYGAPTNQVDMALLLTKNEPADRPAFEYKIVATSRISTMEKELNEAGLAGFRLLPRTIIFKQGFLTAELTMVLERDPLSDATYKYDLKESVKETSLHKQVDEAISGGFAPVTMITLGKHVVVMEKTGRKTL
jgi:hypothetical protein